VCTLALELWLQLHATQQYFGHYMVFIDDAYCTPFMVSRSFSRALDVDESESVPRL